MSKKSIKVGHDSFAIVKDLNCNKLLGTASVFIRRNWLLTAKHVVLCEGLPRENICAIFGAKEIPARVIYFHKEVDLAVLELSETICRYPLASGYASLTGSKGLFCIGYSPTKTELHKRPSLYVNDVSSFEHEARERDFGIEELIIFEAPYSEGGHSGGPILGEGGSIVGVTIQNFRQNDKIYVRATSTAPLVDQLILPNL